MVFTAKETIQHLITNPSTTSPLRHILSKVHVLKQLNKVLHQIIDPKLANYCEIANFSETELVIIVANATWLTRIRFLEMTLLAELRQQPMLSNLQSIHWKIKPPHRLATTPNPATKPLLSIANSQLLTSIAQTIESTPLKEALLRLACNAQVAKEDIPVLLQDAKG